jgi:hypothetical protein
MNQGRLRAATPEIVCPKCGSRTALIPNPHYGVGLAVHRHLRVCERCEWIAIVREQRPRSPASPAAAPAEVKVDVEVEVIKPWRVLGRFLRRRGKTTAHQGDVPSGLEATRAPSTRGNAPPRGKY